MKVFQINTVYGTSSTGRIVADIKHILEENGDECFVAYGRGRSDEKNTKCISNKKDFYYHALMTRITDKTGAYSKRATLRLIEQIETFQPDVIHLHNLHGYYLNIEVLFQFLKKYNKPIVWTLHDCWSFTGHCAWFDYIGCEKWKTGCECCIQKTRYPASRILDNSKWNYEEKKKNFTDIKNMTIVTPSSWLAELVKKSFLASYNVEIIPNGIDLERFKPAKSEFRKKYGLEDKKIILGVANIWEERKGLDDFVKLEKELDENYQIVLIGVSEKQKKRLPERIIAVTHTDSVEDLVEIYSCADVLLNPTYEDNFPTVNLEALACGTPVITYDTGGSPESIQPECGVVVEKGNIAKLVNNIKVVGDFDRARCREHALRYDKNLQLKKYLRLYQE